MSRPVRLRIQATHYPHWGRYSGIGQFTRHLDPQRFVVNYHLASDSDADLPLPHPALRRWLRARVQRRGMPWYKLSDLAAEIRALVACASGRADIVHFLDGEHGGQYLPGWLDRLPRRRAKLVVSYHQPVELLPDLVNPEIVARFDRVVLVAPAQRSYFEAFMPPERVVTILHGIDTDFFHPAVAPAADGVFRCVTAGHWLRDWPTIRRVCERLQACADVEFHVVGNRDTGLEDLPNVRFHRDVDDAALRTLYQSASALLLPLADATANNTLLEALACGLPVLSTDLPAVRSYAGDAAILRPPGDADGLVAAIATLRTDPALRARLGAAARMRAEVLSWKRIAGDYAALYAALLDE